MTSTSTAATATVPAGTVPARRGPRPAAGTAPAPPRRRPPAPGPGDGRAPTSCLVDVRPLAPCLEPLVRFVATARELAGGQGGFAVRAGRDGLALELPTRALFREFGPGRVARFEDIDFPAALTHEPTRRFLRDTGLPEDGVLLRLDTEAPLPTVAEYRADESPGARLPADAPCGADRLVRLGRLAGGTTALLDGTTGTIWNWHETEAVLRPLTADVSTLVLTLWLLHHSRRRTPGPEAVAGFEPA
ncbi:SUKH-4 family immunity protein [Streptomyces tropicalis]|uniref:SUKH-4 family immunity protein n=1 Tax=Streptomyces tropicalis TaxID=3034234 RepID=A0ABT5ZZE0_9ACTN|nr:SUKH-4 family immunity protein [Streptomyces tropicalis]MDF3297752.1 SUKH-4 family immunity protein [Streptomyces tropicalis]